MLKVVLASKSPRRKKLLQQLGLIFEILPSNSEETISSDVPEEIVQQLALEKALDVAPKVNNALVIGSDTIVVLDGHILGKPNDKEDAFSTLMMLSGKQHSVFTGVSFVKTDENGEINATHTFFEETIVQFSSLSESEIWSYIHSGSPMDKAGAYGIQDDWGAVFVERIEGDYYNVVGFPLNRFYRELKSFEPKLVNGIRIPEH